MSMSKICSNTIYNQNVLQNCANNELETGTCHLEGRHFCSVQPESLLSSQTTVLLIQETDNQSELSEVNNICTSDEIAQIEDELIPNEDFQLLFHREKSLTEMKNIVIKYKKMANKFSKSICPTSTSAVNDMASSSFEFTGSQPNIPSGSKSTHDLVNAQSDESVCSRKSIAFVLPDRRPALTNMRAQDGSTFAHLTNPLRMDCCSSVARTIDNNDLNSFFSLNQSNHDIKECLMIDDCQVIF